MVRRVLLVVACVALASGCGSSPPPRDPSSPQPAPPRVRSDALDPAKAPNATTVFNVTALRAGKRTARAVALLAPFLPDGETVDTVDWLAVDGPSPLASPTRNTVFIHEKSRDVRTIRGSQTGFTEVLPPAPPAANELIRINVRSPKKIVRIPFFGLPDGVEELSLVAEGRHDGGADFRLRERCTDASQAANAAAALDAMITRLSKERARAMTGGLFVDAKATVEGTEARLDIAARPDQVETLVELAVALVRGP